MIDPNLHFDWDQWDAVFGQQISVADEFMELDPVAGLGMSDFSNASGGSSNIGDGSTTMGMVYDSRMSMGSLDNSSSGTGDLRMGGTWPDFGRYS